MREKDINDSILNFILYDNSLERPEADKDSGKKVERTAFPGLDALVELMGAIRKNSTIQIKDKTFVTRYRSDSDNKIFSPLSRDDKPEKVIFIVKDKNSDGYYWAISDVESKYYEGNVSLTQDKIRNLNNPLKQDACVKAIAEEIKNIIGKGGQV